MRPRVRGLGRWVVAAALALCPSVGAGQAELRVVISLSDRRLWVIDGADTLLSAPAAVGSDSVLEYQGRRWRFSTPRGAYPVLRKDSIPAWIPPDWHYYEVARVQGYGVRFLNRGRGVTLRDGRRLVVRGDEVGVIDPDSGFVPVPADEEILFDGTVFIPPIGTRNRRIPGELGRYRLALADGISLHGTPSKDSIGHAVTHGCIRLADEDVAWLFANVPIGTIVHIF